MKTEPGSLPDDLIDRVSALLEQVLEAPMAAQPAALAQLCTSHRDCAEALRQSYGYLKQLDLLQISQESPAAAEAEPIAGGLPRSLGPFRLLELLGAGGMGAVYRAEDEELKRPVALKLVRSELLSSARTRSRFQRESEALARLDHPGLCTVYRAGSTDGQPWIAMRLVRGATLASLLETRQAAQRDSAGKASTSSREELQGTLLVFEKIARALATAHQAGVVHRDLKPANIVLTSGDEPVVIDFGLVHLEDSDSHLTVSGDHIGTPAYMAPEQIVPASREPDARTDVYALGVTLFEALTLQSPYHARSREELFQCIVRGERRRLRQAGRGRSADLELVLEKALDLEPGRRYASMVEFAEDLRRVRQHEPPAARRIGPALRLRRWCQRNPVAATFLTLLGLGLGTALALNASRQAESQRRLAMAYGNLAGQVVDKDPEHALDLALHAVKLAPGDPETLGMLVRSLQDVRPHHSCPLPWPEEPRVLVSKVIVSPRGDAALVLGGHGRGLSAPVLWRRGAGAVVLPIENGTFDAHWSADGSMFVTAAPESRPQLWSSGGELVATLEVPQAPRGVRMPRARWLPDGRHLVLTGSDGWARLHDRTTGTWTRLEPRLSRDKPGMRGLAISADGARFALGDQGGCVVVHETAQALRGDEGHVLIPKGPEVYELELSRQGELIQVYSDDPGRCGLWTWEGKQLESWGDAVAGANAAAFDPGQGRHLRLVRGRPPELRRWTGGTLAFEQALTGHVGSVRQAAFRADGAQILTIGNDSTACLWDPASARPLLALRGFDSELQGCAFLAGSACLVVSDYKLHWFDLPGEDEMLQVGAFADTHAVFPGGAWGRVLTADFGQRITVHDDRGAREIREPIQQRAFLDLSSDHRWLVSTSRHRERQTHARIYGPDLQLTQPAIELRMAQPKPVFGPDNQLLVFDVGPMGEGACAHFVTDRPGHWQPSADTVQESFAAACKGAKALACDAPTATLAVARDGAAVTLYHWRAAPPGLESEATLLPGTSCWHEIAFSLDGKRLLLAGTDRVVRLVDRAGRAPPIEITGHLGTVQALGFSRSDKILIAATDSGVAIHDLTGALLLPIRPPAGVVTAAAFLPDGEHVLIATSARVTRIVPIDPVQLVELARSIPRPPMSDAHLRHYRSRVGDD